MLTTPPSGTSQKTARHEALFGVALGAVVMLGMLKFGSPVILDAAIEAPKNVSDLIGVTSWPPSWSWWALIPALLAGVGIYRFEATLPKWVIGAACAWIGWQLIAMATTVDATLSGLTVKHFVTCVACFFAGVYGMGRLTNVSGFWALVALGFFLVCKAGVEQHYGGLAEIEDVIYSEEFENSEFFRNMNVPLEEARQIMMERLAKGRVFGTLVYPNALAGLIILLLPGIAVWISTQPGKTPPILRKIVLGIMVYLGLACLVWSGSKAGWLVMLVMLGIVALQVPLKPAFKIGATVLVLAIGLTAFGIKYSSYFKQGATSVSARGDYWEAAMKNFIANPMTGSGPGTFMRPYAKLKRPESEMARAVHNDYLEQASGSGLVGFISYVVWTLGSIIVLYRRAFVPGDLMTKAVWLGLAGWALHSAAEFFIFIPGISWPAFLLMGWLWAKAGKPSEQPTVIL